MYVYVWGGGGGGGARLLSHDNHLTCYNFKTNSYGDDADSAWDLGIFLMY